MKFEIGQEVLRASWEPIRKRVTCPDCGGTGRLRVTFHDESTVSIECAGCARGYEAPCGYLEIYDHMAVVLPEIITGLEIENGKTEWRTTGTYRASEENLFLDSQAAEARAAEIAAEADRQEREKFNVREKPTRTWAWNAHYHRREIKEAQRRIDYHTKKLAVAAIKAKEPA